VDESRWKYSAQESASGGIKKRKTDRSPSDGGSIKGGFNERYEFLGESGLRILPVECSHHQSAAFLTPPIYAERAEHGIQPLRLSLSNSLTSDSKRNNIKQLVAEYLQRRRQVSNLLPLFL
jgi:hypothetical protein